MNMHGYANLLVKIGLIIKKTLYQRSLINHFNSFYILNICIIKKITHATNKKFAIIFILEIMMHNTIEYIYLL